MMYQIKMRWWDSSNTTLTYSNHYILFGLDLKLRYSSSEEAPENHNPTGEAYIRQMPYVKKNEKRDTSLWSALKKRQTCKEHSLIIPILTMKIEV